MSPDRRDRVNGYYVTSRQFWGGLMLVLAVLGVTPFAVARWVLDQTIAEHVRQGIEKHNGDAIAHASIFRQSDIDRQQILRDIGQMRIDLARVEERIIAITPPDRRH